MIRVDAPKDRPSRLDLRLLALLACGAALVALVAALARHGGDGPARCPPGLAASGPRCCPTGQSFDAGRCVGIASSCSSAQKLVGGRCTGNDERLTIPGGTVQASIDDWDLEGKAAELASAPVETFRMDANEVTYVHWRACVRAGDCPHLRGEPIDPELPVTGVSPREAEVFCRWAGGSLPTAKQWLLAARGSANRRYPWGQFGLVCRRAVYGVVNGPCARGADAAGPEAPGSRPDGASPEGIQDLAGNVAEWTLDGLDGKGTRYAARGGSFASVLASELKGLAANEANQADPRIGFRCVYPP